MSGSMVFSLISGGHVELHWPNNISSLEVEELMEVVTLQCRTIHRAALRAEGLLKAAGEIEYDSWAPEPLETTHDH